MMHSSFCNKTEDANRHSLSAAVLNLYLTSNKRAHLSSPVLTPCLDMPVCFLLMLILKILKFGSKTCAYNF